MRSTRATRGGEAAGFAANEVETVIRVERVRLRRRFLGVDGRLHTKEDSLVARRVEAAAIVVKEGDRSATGGSVAFRLALCEVAPICWGCPEVVAVANLEGGGGRVRDER